MQAIIIMQPVVPYHIINSHNFLGVLSVFLILKNLFLSVITTAHLHEHQRPTLLVAGKVYGGQRRFLSEDFLGLVENFLPTKDLMSWVWSFAQVATAFAWSQRCIAPQSIHVVT